MFFDIWAYPVRLSAQHDIFQLLLVTILLANQSWNQLAAFAVLILVDSDTASGGKPHYSWATAGGGKYLFPASLSACCSLFTVRSVNEVGVERPHLPVDLFTSSHFTCR